MEADIHVDSPLQYASIQIISMQNRYEVFVCGDNKIEKMETGVLDQLLPYLPALKELYAKGSSSNLKLQLPENLHGSRWFTKSTLNRFLNVVSSSELIIKTKAIRGEMSQLEEARKFQISVPAPKHEGDLDSSDTSRNELLRAMDLRFGALRGELALAFCEVASSMYAAEEIGNLAMFSRHFGAIEIENALRGALKSSLRDQKGDPLLNNGSSARAIESRESVFPRPNNSEMPVQYNVSPAQVAQVERDSSTTGSDDSCISDSEDQTSAERSRALARSGSRRRSASPMRRIQIGRSGPRKPAALTIKSLGYFPGRDRGLFAQEEIPANEEGPDQQSGKKPEGDVKRMSVQDKIKIFESKQRDQAAEIEKRRSLATIGANKSVLRRWSAGMGESSSQRGPESDHEDSSPMKPADAPVAISVDEEIPNGSIEMKVEGEEDEDGSLELEHAENESDNKPEHEESGQKLTASAEWTRQKEAELNEMLMKMMETKRDPVKSQRGRTTQELPLEQRGGFYNQYKQKRDEKLQGENAGKRAEKQAKFKAMQEVLNERKVAMASANVNDTGKKVAARKPQQRMIRSVPAQPAKPKKEALSASATKKATPSRTSPLPPTRKSWPSNPSATAPRGTGISPAKTPSGLSSAGTTPTRRKPQPLGPPPPSVSRPKSTKVEKPQMQRKPAKEAPRTNNVRSSKGVVENKKVQPVSRTSKTAKTRPLSGSSDGSGEVPAKPSFYNKVTKKSSVVPLESKPLRKNAVMGAGPLAVPSVTKKSSKPPEEPVNNGLNPSEVQEPEQIDAMPEKVRQHESVEKEAENSIPEPDVTVVTETRENGHEEVCESETFDPVASTEVEHGLKSTVVESTDIRAEEEEEGPTISPMTWVEIEEEQQEEETNRREYLHTSQIEPSITTVPIGSSSPRIRHSLSQMLQEESSEPDINEWGNAENPPSMIFHKDAPKGLKRLLKFARKSKGDGNSSGWSSPSVYSEGEDDSEDPRTSSKRSTDKLLLKAALHAKNFGHPKTFQADGYDKHLDAYDQISGHSGSHKFQDGRGLSAASTTKATRSFFSLSAFRGSKPNETKLR
ncbi:serine/arginine repetitive matrix protein 1-like [Punica granatum]|uniref:Serine/arginine repetitive matrix protein 1-like n=1 Tax=Punica granatum TaxID=22663 RepID=A0A6P8C8C0_PUNGR|nr:serine/arginine repetitive matrix protein 1-like [Punica granatum]XP_031377327.1 serine/arginine repetitive matrix protein 1-like [Punica granatum]XP_031377328.1 serine/arginine repetitive matrix protein 1-like [Punica granatum]XP_031377329.1 serine/arginine repetitive matrix protein 1-like [Punica granatum]